DSSTLSRIRRHPLAPPCPYTTRCRSRRTQHRVEHGGGVRRRRVGRWADRAQEQDGGARQVRGEELEQAQGRQVGGVEVVEDDDRSEEHTSELQSRENLVCRLLLEKKK